MDGLSGEGDNIIVHEQITVQTSGLTVGQLWPNRACYMGKTLYSSSCDHQGTTESSTSGCLLVARQHYNKSLIQLTFIRKIN